MTISTSVILFVIGLILGLIQWVVTNMFMKKFDEFTKKFEEVNSTVKELNKELRDQLVMFVLKQEYYNDIAEIKRRIEKLEDK